MALEDPQLDWKQNTPESLRFGDIYYMPECGQQESRFVFIENNQLPRRWQMLKEKPEASSHKAFVITETGFGTGLNFLNSVQLWQELNPPGQLHFISFEKYPLSRAQLKKALAPFPELAQQSQKLIELYPPTIQGFHSIRFSETITLQVYFGDAIEGLKSLNGDQFKTDAWFLDGFSPATNPGLWSEELFQHCQPLNKAGSTFATFTSAGHVKRKLQAIGFECNKTKGFGKKREMLVGEFSETANNQSDRLYPVEQKPWFIKTQAKQNETEKVAIIGAGLAGCWSAHFLAKRGLNCDIYEAGTEIASGASGNPRGASYLKITDTHSLEKLSQYFYVHAYLFSVRQLGGLFPENQQIWDQSGLLQLAHTEALAESYQQFNNKHPLKDVVQYLNREQASELAGIKLDYDALFFPAAGHASPPEICKALCEQTGITVHCNQGIESLAFNEGSQQWALTNAQKEIFCGYDAVIIANSHSARLFEQSAELPLHQVRGQSTQLWANDASQALKTVICSKGYLTPAQNNSHTIGSTFDPRNKTDELMDKDNLTNLDYLEHYTPDFYARLDNNKIQSARAGLRCQTADMLPVAGQLPDYPIFKKDYQDIAKGQLKKHYPAANYLPGLFVNTGHASRGLISAPYCAELIAREICGEANLCENSIEHALSPTRFFIRELKKGKSA